MAVSVGSSINETHYTTLRSGINTVMGTPSGSGNSSAGYNQSISAPSVSVGTTITASQWNSLRGDIRKASAHQTNSAVALTTVDTDTGITATIHNEFETALATVTSNRFVMATAQSTLSTARSANKSGGWNGTQQHDVQLTWGSSNAFKAFWNAGGTVKIVSSLSYTGSEAKTLDWKSLVNDAKHISVNYTSAYADGGGNQGTVTNTGMYDLNTNGTEVKIFQDGGTNPYSENDYQIFIRYITNGIRVRVVFRDDDAGDQTGVGPAEDENVKGTLTSAIYYRRATGSNVEVTAPSVATGGSNTF
jgi:hypothetical protein